MALSRRNHAVQDDKNLCASETRAPSRAAFGAPRRTLFIYDALYETILACAFAVGKVRHWAKTTNPQTKGWQRRPGRRGWRFSLRVWLRRSLSLRFLATRI